ncbi:DUF3710 domain-containing protein [Streptomyces macrolidinus]|uniref:DUF3710 domain-containing protein n=1 Tax=Streptomyces macrolidinus TaxID=2952607 RepID=UPI003557DFAB
MSVVRGRDAGPWDVTETGWAGVSLMDLGGLKIPLPSGLDEVRLEAGGNWVPVVVTVVYGRTAIQLQAFMG